MEIESDDFLIQNARIFHDTGCEVMKKHEELNEDSAILSVSYLSVAATNVHFAVELALKALVILTVGKESLRNKIKGVKQSGHDLYVLFNKLDQRRQGDIGREFNIKMAPRKDRVYALKRTSNADVDKVFDEYTTGITQLLIAHKDGFMSWRYSFEDPKSKEEAQVLLFDFKALAVLFQILQIHIGQVKYSQEAKSKRINAKEV